MVIKKVCNLKGSVRISGSKNAAIPIICTSLIARDVVILKNVPLISDIKKLIKILGYVNCKMKLKNNTLKIDSRDIVYKPLIIDECSEIRGSYYLIPVFLYLFNKCEILLPGGCNIGQRPIDAHIDAFEAMGCKVEQKGNHLWINRINDLDEIKYSMSKASVGASINAIVCALKSKYTVIDKLVLEPEGIAVIDFLKVLGFNIIHLKDKCVIKSRDIVLHKFRYKIIPDRMEAMTFIIMGLLCGNIKVRNANPDHMKHPLDLLKKNGYDIIINKKYIYTNKSRGSSFDVKTDIYPFFPTDMQPIYGVLLAHSRGSCVVEDTIFENRMKIYEDINDSGGNINIIGNKAYIIGNNQYKANEYRCEDLRHSAAVMLMVLKNGGRVNNIGLIQRGYEDFFFKIKRLGAKFIIK